MPADFYIDPERRIVFSKAMGVFNSADALDHMERLLRHPAFHAEFNQLLDFRQLTALALSSDEIRWLAQRTVFSANSLRAFVVSSDLQFGMGRLFATHREFEGEKGIIIFRDMQEALTWLSLPAEPDPKMFTHLGSLPVEAS
jgi:hypothetical protein